MRLAARQPIDEVRMSALAAEAGVSRSALYEHAGSPRELLEGVLVAELDSFREAHLVGIGPDQVAEATRAVAGDVIAHADRYAAVYRTGLDTAGGRGSLHALLSRHFSGSFRLLLEAHDVDPGEVSPALRPYLFDMLARSLADSAVGAMAMWLEQPEPRDPAVFVELNRLTLPAWWPSD